MAKTGGNGKVVVIGLDGGSFAVIDPLIKEGKLPNIARLIEEGVRGDLESTVPPVTGPAWASFMTGKSPGAHSLFDFVKRVPNESARQIVNYNHIKSKTLWSILSEQGKKIGIINVPITYPPSEVSGFLISGMLTPSIQSQYTYPASLSQELEAKFGQYVLDIWWQHYGPKRIKRFLQDLMDCTNKRGKIALYLMESREWDLFMTVFIGMDRIQHALWNFLFPLDLRNLSPKEEEIRDLIIEYYQLVDSIIGKLVAAVDGNGNLVIMSDHGFGPLNGKLYINKWLEDLGLLTYDRTKINRYRTTHRLASLLRSIVSNMDLLRLRKMLMIAKARETRTTCGFLDCIDWSRTVAYAASNTEQGIYLNLEGREPYGIVKPGGDWEETRDFIIEKLRELKHPETKEKLASRIYKREDIYSGPYVNDAPDIIFLLREGQYLADVQPSNYLIERPSWKTGTGTHRMEGVFIGYGRDIRNGIHISNARIIDVAPTVLNLMNVPIPDDMDGRVLTEIFAVHFLKDNPPLYVGPSDQVDSDKEADGLYSDSESAHLKEQLKGLGYL
ncbi:MAG: alkaline phosphatase family protein [Desulfobacterales bacterium]|nr:alkaline phosphatase family protein [Desulfobacterales bacterium]